MRERWDMKDMQRERERERVRERNKENETEQKKFQIRDTCKWT